MTDLGGRVLLYGIALNVAQMMLSIGLRHLME